MLALLTLLALGDPSRGFGFDACVIGDVDRDGKRDVLLPGYVDREWTPAGATVLSGADGSALRSIDFAGARVWSAVSLSDLDADGCDDFAVVSRSGESRCISAYSAARGAWLWTRPIASSAETYSKVRAAADDDCDGTDDVWIESGPYEPRGASTCVTVLSGVDGRVLRADRIDRGQGLTPIGDADGDGRTDSARIVLDCHQKDLHVQILESKHGFRPRAIGVVNVACTWIMRVHDVGDLDGDGLHDVGVSALDHGVHVFSSRGSGLLFEHEMEFEHPPMSGYGSDLRGVVDEAGRSFVLVGVEYADVYSGQVEVWSVAKQQLVTRIQAPDKREVHFGARIETMDDLDRDGTPDFLCIPDHTSCGEPSSIYACSTKSGQSVWFAAGHGSTYSVIRDRAPSGFRADPRAGKRITADGGFGLRSCAIGDLDSDGRRELLVVTRQPDGIDPLGLVLSGADGHALGEIELVDGLPISRPRELWIADAVALADLDRDGTDDFGIERRDDHWRHERWFTAYSTCTGLPLWTVAGEPDEPRFGKAMQQACDEDRDGTTDVLVAGAVEKHGDGATLATIVSGATGRPLRRIPARAEDFGDHACFVTVGDADGDGAVDVARAIKSESRIELEWLPSRDGTQRHLGVVPIQDCEHFGLERLPDLDGDGALDVGVWIEREGFRVVSTRTARTLAEELGRHETWTRFCSALAAFVDHEGSAAILVSDRDGMMWAGSVSRRGLQVEVPIFTCDPCGDEWHFGARLWTFDDVDRDGTPDFVAVSDHSRGNQHGCLFLCSGRDGRTLWSARPSESGLVGAR